MIKRLINLLLERGDVEYAGRCMVRMSPGRIYATYHDSAPPGISACPVCGRWVVRKLPYWWAS